MPRLKWKALIGSVAAGTAIAFLPDVLKVVSPSHSWGLGWDFLKMPGLLADLQVHGAAGSPNMFVVNTVDIVLYTVVASAVFWCWRWLDRLDAKPAGSR